MVTCEPFFLFGMADSFRFFSDSSVGISAVTLAESLLAFDFFAAEVDFFENIFDPFENVNRERLLQSGKADLSFRKGSRNGKKKIQRFFL